MFILYAYDSFKNHFICHGWCSYQLREATLESHESITGENTKRHKPHPDPYLLGLVKFNTDKKKTLVIEESISGIKSVKR